MNWGKKKMKLLLKVGEKLSDIVSWKPKQDEINLSLKLI
jgi:hypothetical protein